MLLILGTALGLDAGSPKGTPRDIQRSKRVENDPSPCFRRMSRTIRPPSALFAGVQERSGAYIAAMSALGGRAVLNILRSKGDRAFSPRSVS